jgi:uncharacterized SAM-binding protein YcdF (DUF218 family)
MRRLTKQFATVVLLSLTVYLVAAAAIAAVGLRDHTSNTADIIVVPGNTVQADGTLSKRLQSRLDVAIGLLREGRANAIFVSGGIGREGHDEAAAMAAYLVSQGVSAAAVVQDPLGVDTAATAIHAAKYLQTHQLQTAIVATQYFHIARTTLALERAGIRVTGTRHANYFELRDVYSLTREVIGHAAYYLKL